MNKVILNTVIQDFISANISSDITDLLLKGFSFEGVKPKEVIGQIEAKKRCEKKLPTWFRTKGLYFPNKLNIEQTSSEITAHYKANLVSGKSLIDLTGGFGVDSYFFSKKIESVTHCEINSELSELVKYNFKILGTKNIHCLNQNGIEVLKQLDQSFDWIYVDPSRRDSSNKKVFLLKDSTPNIITFQRLFLKYAKNILIKTSPLLDIKATKNELHYIKELHIIAVDNEVKELLWVLERDFESDFMVKTVNIKSNKVETFDFYYLEEEKAEINFSQPLSYLYEPNTAILKSGGFKVISSALGIPKLHKHSHLYTSDRLIDFPGRRFKIEKLIDFNKKKFVKENISKANVTTRNFPLSVGDIRRKLKIRDGGDKYLFFTTNAKNEKIILSCTKIK